MRKDSYKIKHFFGVVEDRNDPAQAGRVRVRVVNAHTENKDKIPTESLPWAHVLKNPHGFTNVKPPVEGTWVYGFFADGELCQQPFVCGICPGTVSDQPYDQGFTDPAENLDERPQYPARLSISSSGRGSTIVNESAIPYPYMYYVGKNGQPAPTPSEVPGVDLLAGKIPSVNPRCLELPDVPDVPDLPTIDSLDLEIPSVSFPKPTLDLYLPPKLSIVAALQAAKDLKDKAKPSPFECVPSIPKPDIPELPSQSPLSISKPAFGISSITSAVQGAVETATTTATASTTGADVRTGNVTKKPSGRTYVGEPLSSRLSRGEPNIIINGKLESAVRDIQVASRSGSVSWNEQYTAYDAKYPYNNAYESESGHVLEFDDTKGAERIHIYHRSGTFTEFHPDGNQTNRIVNDQQNLVLKNLYEYVGGDATTTYNKSRSVLAKQDYLLIGQEDVIITGKRVHLGSRDIGAQEQPLVLGYQLVDFIAFILEYLDTHTHPSATGPTGPPSVSPVPSSIGIGPVAKNPRTIKKMRQLLSQVVTTK